MAELTAMILSTNNQYKLRKSGAAHHARFMAKCISLYVAPVG